MKTLTLKNLSAKDIKQAVKADSYITGQIDKSVDVVKNAQLAFNEQAGDEQYHEIKIFRTIKGALAKFEASISEFVETSNGSAVVSDTLTQLAEKFDIILTVNDRMTPAFATTMAYLAQEYIINMALYYWWQPIKPALAKDYAEAAESNLIDVKRCLAKSAPDASATSYNDITGTVTPITTDSTTPDNPGNPDPEEPTIINPTFSYLVGEFQSALDRPAYFDGTLELTSDKLIRIWASGGSGDMLTYEASGSGEAIIEREDNDGFVLFTVQPVFDTKTITFYYGSTTWTLVVTRQTPFITYVEPTFAKVPANDTLVFSEVNQYEHIQFKLNTDSFEDITIWVDDAVVADVMVSEYDEEWYDIKITAKTSQASQTLVCISSNNELADGWERDFTVKIVPVSSEPTEPVSPNISWSANSFSATEAGVAANAPTLNNTNGVPVTYSSSNTNVATINANGQLTVVGNGTCTITATSTATEDYTSQTVTYTLTVAIQQTEPSEQTDPVLTYYVGTPSSSNQPQPLPYGKNIITNDTITVIANGGSGGTLTYDASDTIAVTRQDSDDAVIFTITPNASGWVSFNYGTTGWSIHIDKGLDPNISWSADSFSATEAGVAANAPTLNNPNSVSVNYNSNDPSKASIDANGQLTIVGNGTCTITAKSVAENGYVSVTVSYEVTINIENAGSNSGELTDPTVNGETTRTIHVGETDTILVNNDTIENAWSENSSCLSVSVDTTTNTITVEALAETSSVTRVYIATADRTVQGANLSVVYTIEPAAASASSPDLSWSANTYHAMGTGTPADAPTLTNPHSVSVTYSSSDTSVATVDQNGAVTVVGYGYAAISAVSTATAEYVSQTASYQLDNLPRVAIVNNGVEDFDNTVVYMQRGQTVSLVVRNGTLKSISTDKAQSASGIDTLEITQNGNNVTIKALDFATYKGVTVYFLMNEQTSGGDAIWTARLVVVEGPDAPDGLYRNINQGDTDTIVVDGAQIRSDVLSSNPNALTASTTGDDTVHITALTGSTAGESVDVSFVCNDYSKNVFFVNYKVWPAAEAVTLPQNVIGDLGVTRVNPPAVNQTTEFVNRSNTERVADQYLVLCAGIPMTSGTTENPYNYVQARPIVHLSWDSTQGKWVVRAVTKYNVSIEDYVYEYASDYNASQTTAVEKASTSQLIAEVAAAALQHYGFTGNNAPVIGSALKLEANENVSPLPPTTHILIPSNE